MAGLIYAIVTVLAWGTWLAPSQNVPLKSQQVRTFYVTLAVLLLALSVALAGGVGTLTARSFWLPFLGGIIWAASGLSAFIGADRLGMAKAFGIWAPLNILVSIAWGMLLFGEFLKTGSANLAWALAAVSVIIAGVLLIIFSGGEASDKNRFSWVGLAGALGAGLGWGSYFVPIRISELSMWVAMLPMALGMFAGSCLLLVVSKSSLRLNSPAHYPRLIATGLLWAIGNYGALKMMELIGTGRGFTIAQLCVVVNALIGIFWMKNPKPGTRAARLTLIGVTIATLGGIVLGNLKS
jgi:glucose uptake protein